MPENKRCLPQRERDGQQQAQPAPAGASRLSLCHTGYITLQLFQRQRWSTPECNTLQHATVASIWVILRQRHLRTYACQDTWSVFTCLKLSINFPLQRCIIYPFPPHQGGESNRYHQRQRAGPRKSPDEQILPKSLLADIRVPHSFFLVIF